MSSMRVSLATAAVEPKKVISKPKLSKRLISKYVKAIENFLTRSSYWKCNRRTRRADKIKLAPNVHPRHQRGGLRTSPRGSICFNKDRRRSSQRRLSSSVTVPTNCFQSRDIGMEEKNADITINPGGRKKFLGHRAVHSFSSHVFHISFSQLKGASCGTWLCVSGIGLGNTVISHSAYTSPCHGAAGSASFPGYLCNKMI